MDAAEVEQDVQLQRTSPELLADLQRSLKPFLWKTTKSGKPQIRGRVRTREADRLVNLLEPFQELPQLLDPHLDKLVPVLADAFLAYLRAPPIKDPISHTQLLIPLSRAICRLLYTFCKIRGEKVIVRFLSTETRYLELLLSAIETGDSSAIARPHRAGGTEAGPAEIEESSDAWQWEERYITLLWLSQLLLAPFDLASISSEGTQDTPQTDIPGLIWPESVPGVTLRVIPLAIQYLSSSGKESAAAKVLLVRIAMRKDMQELRILHSLVQWALSRLRASSKPADDQYSTYYVVGILSFLAGILASSEGTADLDPYLGTIFSMFEGITADPPAFQVILSSAVARKAIVKIFRTVVLLLLRKSGNLEEADPALLRSIGGSDEAQAITARAIGQFLEYVEDPATPVRLAASKALSLVTLKLEPELGIQIVDTLLDMFKINVLWVARSTTEPNNKIRDLSRVNPLAWHGLVWTLSSLLYRHSPPVSSLPGIISCLLVGLSFEQRSSNGASIGTNVRDAACFGIWAIARRYRTEELQAISLDSQDSGDEEKLIDPHMGSAPSLLQTLATRLVVSASLDPSGNIRRASSAALQELIGRHPDNIIEGIQIVQLVDYHSVARRSRAIRQVALQAAQLSKQYCCALLDGLLGWRGIKDYDASARRTAADAFGSLAWLFHCQFDPDRTKFCNIITKVDSRIRRLATREVEARHGHILCMASLLRQLKQDLTPQAVIANLHTSCGPGLLKAQLRSILDLIATLLTNTNRLFSTARNPELLAEATSQLLTSVYPLLRAESVFRRFESYPQPFAATEIDSNNISEDLTNFLQPSINILNYPQMTFGTPSLLACEAARDIQAVIEAGYPLDHNIISLASNLLVPFHQFNDEECAESVSETASNLTLLVGREKRETLIADFLLCFKAKANIKAPGRAIIYTLFKILPPCTEESQRSVIKEIRTRAWRPENESTRDIETCATILKCLSKSSILTAQASEFVEMIGEGLDDYTTNARGDVGSIIRIEAAKAASVLWKDGEFVLKSKLLGLSPVLSALRSRSPITPSIASVPSHGLQALEAELTPCKKIWGDAVVKCKTMGEDLIVMSESFRLRRLDPGPNRAYWGDGSLNAVVDELKSPRPPHLFLNMLFGKVLRCATEKLDKVRIEAQKSVACALRDREQASKFQKLACSSAEYFRFLLDLQTNDWLAAAPFDGTWTLEMLQGYVTSADTGNEDLVRSSRAALAEFCETGEKERDLICGGLFRVLMNNKGNDRVEVPTLEVVGFLFDVRIIQKSCIGFKALYILVQQSHYRSSNIRKIEACIKVYGGLVKVYPPTIDKLVGMLKHKYPRVRERVAEELWMVSGGGGGKGKRKGNDEGMGLKGIAWGKQLIIKDEDVEPVKKALGLG